MLVEPLALLRQSAASPEDIASSGSLVTNTSSASAPGRSSTISLNTSFRMSGGPFCTCASKLHARTSSRVHWLYLHSHVCRSIELLTLRNLRLLLKCPDGCLVLYHSSDIDPFSVLDLWELHGLLHWITRHLSCLALALWEPGVAFVTATPTIFCASESHAPALRHNGPCPPLRSRTALEHLNQSSGSPGWWALSLHSWLSCIAAA